jgi:PBP1b-binding outer membrane lipoprotein LpoB
MKKMILLGMILCTAIFLFSCSSRDFNPIDDDTSHDQVELTDFGIQQRKMIYKVETSLRVHDLNEVISVIKSNVLDDEWFDRETISKNYAYLEIRIKTERLDEFLASISNYQADSFEKTGTDISLSYKDKADKIVSLEAQRERLVQLYLQASLSDMIIINRQISDLDVQLANLKGELIVFDSLVEYSQVIIRINQSTVVTQSPFFNRLLNALLLGVNGIVKLIEGVLISLAFLLPILAVLVPAGFGTYKGLKWYGKKQKNKKIVE